MINSKILQVLSFEEVCDRFLLLGLPEIDAEFWNAIRGNIVRFEDVKFWWKLCRSEIIPIIQDTELCNLAIQTIPKGELTPEIWPKWIALISEKTGKRGKSLFQPLRLALTGKMEGPEVKNLLRYMGRERVLKRLSGTKA